MACISAIECPPSLLFCTFAFQLHLRWIETDDDGKQIRQHRALRPLRLSAAPRE